MIGRPDTQLAPAMGLMLWLAVVMSGAAAVLRYTSEPGPYGVSPRLWPAGSAIARADNRFTLVMLVHPHCPCSWASVEELEHLMAQSGDRLVPYVLFVMPRGVEEGWERTGLWDRVAAIPRVRAVRDDAGAEALRFGALTSGQTLVYDADGALRFAGGITDARGHTGDNAGVRTILAVVAGHDARTLAPVYGCSLLGDEPRTAEGERYGL